jgi:transcription initiation factor TFIIB
MNYTVHDKGLSTMVGWGNRDSYGKSIPTRARAQVYRLRKWQGRIRAGSASERNLAAAFSELDRVASNMGLPRNVREAAAMVYRRAVEKNLIRGRSIEGVIAAAVYAACRQCGAPRTLDEIADSSRIDRKEIGRTYRFIARELTLKLMPTSPQDYTARFCSELGLNEDANSKALEIITQAEEKELTSGRGPTGVAAAAIYIASILCGERKTQKDVADIAGVTEVTIRNRYKEIAEQLDLDIVL